MTRITHGTATRTMLSDIMAANRGMIRAQERISSQKELTRASDGPSRALAALDHRAVLQRSAQFQRNASDARGWMVAGDTALTSGVELMTHVRSLIISARSGATDPNALKAIASEVAGSREAMLSLANSQHQGRPIFSGTANTTNAFDVTGAYLGDAGVVMRPVAPSVTLQVNRNGAEVFGATDADPMNGNVFQLLDAIVAAIDSGDGAQMDLGLQQLDVAVDRIETAQVALGARARQVEDVMARNEISDIDRRTALSEAEDVDMAQALIDMRAKEFSYQAALSASAKVLQTSLLDFLR